MNRKLNKFKLKRLFLLVIALAGIVVQAKADYTYYANMTVHVGKGSGTVYVGESGQTSQTLSTGTKGGNITFTLGANASTGYSFAGWYSDSDCTYSANGTVAASNTDGETAYYNRYAKFTENNYYAEMTAHASGASGGGTVLVAGGSSGTTSTYTNNTLASPGGSTSFTLTASANSGYYFVGWYKDSGFTQLDNRNSSYNCTVPTSSTANGTASYTRYARFISADTWNEDLISGATYTVTTEGDRFRVTCSNTNSYNHNLTFLYVGNVTANSGTATINFNNTQPLKVNGLFKVNGSATLTLNKTNTNNNVTLIRKDRTGNLFEIAASGRLNVNGYSSSAMFIVDGGTVFGTEYDARTAMTTTGATGNMFYVLGHLTMQDAILQNGNGVCIYANSSGTDNTKYEMKLDNVKIRGFYAQSGAAVFLRYQDYHNAVFTNVTISGCKSHAADNGGGGTIRTNGGVKTVLTLDNCTIENCYSGENGGGVYWNAAGIPGETKIIIKNSTKIRNNEAGIKGGGIFVESEMELESVIIDNNIADQGGGIFLCTYQGGENQYSGDGYSLNVTENVEITNNTAWSSGGGAYMLIRTSNDIGFNPAGNPIDATFQLVMSGGKISGNHAPVGAGVSINDCAPKKYIVSDKLSGTYIRKVKISGGEIKDNICTNTKDNVKGAGIYIRKYKDSTIDYSAVGGAGLMEVSISGGNICSNIARNDNGNGVGGGFYINNEMPQEAPYYSECTIEINKEDGEVHISGNECDGNGAGLYVENGEIEIKGGKVGEDGLPNISHQGNGAGVYVGNGKIAISEGNVDYNQARYSNGKGGYGGAFYLTGGTATISGGSVSHNKADKNGGGVYLEGKSDSEKATAGFSNGSLDGNMADVNGGAVYVGSFADLNMTGNSSITGNSAVYGAGAYIATGGTMSMSGSSSITGNETTSLSGHGAGIYQGGTFNVSGSSLQVTGNLLKGTAKDTGIQNNVYLPSTSNYITIVAPGLSGSANIGITVPDFPAPVIYSDNTTYLNDQCEAFQSGTSQLKDDRNICQALYDASYDPNYIYFIGTWQGYVHSLGIDPSSYTDASFSTIDSPEKLAIYMSYVNGVNGFAKHPSANGIMTADVDMSEYFWIPIGTKCTSGTEGAETEPYAGTFNGQGHVIRGLNVNGLIGYANYGLFGDVAGGMVKDVFLTDCDFSSYGECTMGTLVGQMNGGTVMNAEGAGKLGVSNSNSTLGGLVGAVTNGARIVNGMAMCDMTGTKMGGLAGTVASESSIENSFSNAKLTYSGTAGSHTGGIAADNAGTVTNCYSRLREGSATGSSYGSLVGSNSGTVSNSYAQTSNYVKSGSAGSGLGTYSPTETPYGYGQAEDGDNKVGDTPLCDKLNGNLSEGYAQWMRTSASPINGDYPILKLGYESVASADGIVLEYGSLDQSFLRHDTGTALLYGAASVSEAQPSGMTLYIDEDAVMTQSAPGAISAYVGVTFDNSANPEESGTPYDWHMFSTPLADAPLGISYTDNDVAPYGTDPAQYGFTAGGYFPTNTPYANFDYYCFDEPSCHWINFKRNSASHWHSDGEHANITYSNEDELIPGKGYLMAIAEETYLQSHGTLNDGEVKRAVTTSGANLTGYNLLGNPYQSYLDFDAFADKNASLWDEGSENANSYLILDSDKGAYITYVKGGSEGGEYASRYLHPHQGFFVRVDNAGEAAFGNDMRSISVAGGEPYFRGEEAKVNYPLVNLYAADESGKRDILVVELERPEQSGAEKMSGIRNAECQVYSSSDGTDYSVLFAKGHVTEVPVRFEAFSDGEFTFTWNTQNGEFSYLHLIDNLAGMDCDCLSADSYTFTASTEDYRSRFKLKLEYKSEMPAAEESAESFAYQTGDELVVNGTGYVQIVDMLGRVLYETRVTGAQSRIAVPSDAKGLCMVRLMGSEGVKVQKMVVK